MIHLTEKEKRQLESIWLNDFHEGKHSRMNMTDKWVMAFDRFLEGRGDEIISGNLRDMEHKIIEMGLSQEYMSELARTVNGDGARTEYDKAVLILTATPEERALAVKKVLS